MSNSSKLIKWFKGIAIIAILWNLMGLFSFFAHTFISEEAKALLPEAESALYNNIPLWKIIAFAVAIFGGLIGSILLFMKKKLAIPVFILSLIGIIVSFTYDFMVSNLLEVYGNTSVIFPLIIALIGVFLVWYSKKLDAKGFLS
jgi:hypothetical protein